MTTQKLSLVEITKMTNSTIKQLNGTILVSSRYVLSILISKLKSNNVNFKMDFKKLSVEILS